MIQVHVIDHDTRDEVGVIELSSPEALKQMVQVDWRPFEINGEECSFRFHGYEWTRLGDEVVASLFVSEE